MRGEFELIDLLRERIAAAGAPRAPQGRLLVASGDDAAITVPGGATATSVDAIVDGVHFRRATFEPPAIGYKAVAAAVSDLAAMGAAPGEAYVQLGVPADLSDADLTGIADGLGEAAAAAGLTIAGGDVVASPVLFVGLTVVGHGPAADSFVTRAGARLGDAVVVTGALGAAAAGLILLEQPQLEAELEARALAELRERQLRPALRLEAGQTLARAGAGAMVDISDGLVADAGHVARASGVRIELELASVPAARGVAEVAGAAGRPTAALVGCGGEDYELLATLSPAHLPGALDALRQAGFDPATIGRVETGEGVVLRDASGREVDAAGFDQLGSRAPAGPA